mmetsp:Transcript_20111/g.60201  ORF Transcript_20111/g.60201 Transcript_20111/m.60201 type:complete len:262 (-) Transcript_20111:262-1047(-)
MTCCQPECPGTPMYANTHAKATKAHAIVPIKTRKLSGSLAFAGLMVVFSKSSMLLLEMMETYSTSFKHKMNSSATAFKIKSAKLLVASSQRQPTHKRYIVMANRGMMTRTVRVAFILLVNRAMTKVSPSPLPKSSSFSKALAMLSVPSVSKTNDWNISFVFRSSATHVSVHTYITAKKNSGCESGMRHAAPCRSPLRVSSMARSKCGPSGPPMPRRSSVGSSEWTYVWLRYMTTSNLSYTSRMSCTALAHTKRLTCARQYT